MIGKDEARTIIGEVMKGVSKWKTIAVGLGISKREIDMFTQCITSRWNQMAHRVVLTEVVVDMAGTDWKSALAALGGSSEENESKEKKVDRKKRVGVVYSTNPELRLFQGC